MTKVKTKTDISFHVYTDGSHRPPDNSGYAYLIFSEKTKHIVDMKQIAHRGMTINQCELLAIDKALDYPNLDHACIYTDSAYCISALTLWRHTWIRNNWLTPSQEPVKNKDLIKEIGEKIDRKQKIVFKKVKAHAGDPFNSVVDYLAQGITTKMRNDLSIDHEIHSFI